MYSACAQVFMSGLEFQFRDYLKQEIERIQKERPLRVVCHDLSYRSALEVNDVAFSK